MAIKHVVRCDGAECGREVDLIASANTQALDGVHRASYLVPREWKQIDNREFCSWQCLGQYAEAAQKQGKR